jgi:L-lactate dehydrogenase (cytochrome)
MKSRAVLVGRAFLYGLMAGGERVVTRAGDILRTEMIRTMLGVQGISELVGRVRIRQLLDPALTGTRYR